MGGTTWKGPLWPESLTYQKKDGRILPVGMTLTFQKIIKKNKFKKNSFFWYDKDSGHYGPFRVMQPIWTMLVHLKNFTVIGNVGNASTSLLQSKKV